MMSRPEIVVKEIDGQRQEPIEELVIDVAEEFQGTVIQLCGTRRGTMTKMVNNGSGRVRLEFRVPSRGLIGLRSELLTETRGTGLMHHVFDTYEPWFGELRTRPTGSLVADRRGQATAFAITNLQERGSLFISPGDELYEGMVVGENARGSDIPINVAKKKHLTNVRASRGDMEIRLTTPRQMSLDETRENLQDNPRLCLCLNL